MKNCVKTLIEQRQKGVEILLNHSIQESDQFVGIFIARHRARFELFINGMDAFYLPPISTESTILPLLFAISTCRSLFYYHRQFNQMYVIDNDIDDFSKKTFIHFINIEY